ncbi:MAG: hypothetical protein KZQ95_07820 [Candidatus Thiodiazotropha sp. (ex Epidulcina cf. delphinae)]|nr:hypothetical protein [Candidatus Thiodiazotropha sp. (ex Epidulcina cf. delphinae)]
MNIKKDGCIVKCEHCQCVSNNGRGGFDVQVPICADDNGIAGTARLHCAISAERHRVELVNWKDTDDHTVTPPKEIQKRLATALDFVADHRVCGNQKICPAEVIEIVEKHGTH